MSRVEKHILLVVFAWFLITVSGCRSINGYNSKPSKNSAFTDDKNQVDIDVVAYHLNDSVTKVFFRLATENLMYKRVDTTQNFYSNLLVSCKLLPDINSRNIIDSASVALIKRFPEVNESKVIEGSFILKVKQLNYGYLDLWVVDRHKNLKHTKAVSVSKINSSVDQNFLVFQNEKLTYKNTFYAGEEVVIQSERNKQNYVYVDCFKDEFKIALPPFSNQKPDEFKYKPDSTFKLLLDQNLSIQMPVKGFYHLKADQYSFDGLSLYTFERSYPGVNDINEMINCTRYIMSKEEFETCKNSNDQKACIDHFWLNIAGSNERAKELLKKYYSRVKEANIRFTSYTQGWKTDRGMISIIFGEPINVYKSKSEEIWVYGPESDVNSLRFVFKRTDNPFSSNDYILQRSYMFKEPWYTAVDYWRQGRLSIEN